MKRGEWDFIQIAAVKEAQHQIRFGDSGVGKTSLTYQDLLHAEAFDIPCVVNDPKGGEFIARFYKPERGDVILNPTDARCAYWGISGEGYDLATYKVVMTALFPPPVVRDPTSDIFNQWTVSLGAYLLDEFRPSTELLGAWIGNYPEIEKRVKGTIHEYTLPANSPNQRAGVLGTLALAGDPLWMMPPLSERRKWFCIREWTRNPQGWVFISSDPDTRPALKPLMSLWMDLFILGLLSSKTERKIKLIYDELQTLQTLPRLADGITMLRSRGHQIIASVQNQEQIHHLYGDQTRTIISQAYTKWIFATSDPDSADLLERIGGKRKLLRLEQTDSHGAFFEQDRKSSRVAQVEEPAINATQIKGMGDLHAYFVQRGFNNRMVVVPVEIPYVNLPEREPAYLRRVIPRRDFKLPPDVEAITVNVTATAAPGVAALPPPLAMPPLEKPAALDAAMALYY